jgi:hypothetical protein
MNNQLGDSNKNHDVNESKPVEVDTPDLCKPAKVYSNFDDFMSAQGKPDIPLHEQKVDRDEYGDSGKHYSKYREDEPRPKVEMRLRDYFPDMSVDGEVIRNLFWEGEDIYEKIMSICMFIAVGAVFNPVLTLGFAFLNADFIRVGFGLFLVGFFLFSLLAVRKSFHLIGMGIIACAKLIYFREGIGDVSLATAMMMTIYLMYNMKKRKDTEIAAEGMRAARREFAEEQGDESENSESSDEEK